MEMNLDNVLTEQQLLTLFAPIKKEGLSNLRRKEGLPFIKVNERIRVYLEADVFQWLQARRTTLGFTG